MLARFLISAAAVSIALTGIAHTQPLPPLPELKFAPISVRESYLGDRRSCTEAGRADAPVILLLHGVGASSMHWRYQFAGLSDSFRVIAWNAPGYMLSDAFKTEWPGCANYAAALSDFMGALRIGRVNMVGNSFGSRVAQCFAMYFPNQVRRLAMTGTGVGPKGMSEEEKGKIVATREAQIAKGGYGFGARVDALLAKNASEATKALVADVLRATNPRGFMHGVKLGLADGYDPETVAAKVTAPVLMISGNEDRVNPIDKNAAVLAKAMPKARLEILEGVGHLPEVEAPEKVNALLRSFFVE
jgi:pimeloyl-ACP methyl ester carboxylesterase